MDYGLTVTKFVRIVIPKIAQIPHNLFARSAQIGQNSRDIIEKSPYWVSVVRGSGHTVWPLRAKLEIA